MVQLDHYRETSVRIRGPTTQHNSLPSGPLLVLASARYVDALAGAYPNRVLVTPLAHLGIGQQRHQLAYMRENATTARSPRFRTDTTSSCT